MIICTGSTERELLDEGSFRRGCDGAIQTFEPDVVVSAIRHTTDDVNNPCSRPDRGVSKRATINLGMVGVPLVMNVASEHVPLEQQDLLPKYNTDMSPVIHTAIMTHVIHSPSMLSLKIMFKEQQVATPVLQPYCAAKLV